MATDEKRKEKVSLGASAGKEKVLERGKKMVNMYGRVWEAVKGGNKGEDMVLPSRNLEGAKAKRRGDRIRHEAKQRRSVYLA